MRTVSISLVQRGLAYMAAVVVIASGCCMPAVGAEAPDAAFIAAALQQQENASIDVVFTTSDKPTVAPDAKEVTDFMECHYIRTSEALWIKEKFNVSSKEVAESSYDRASKEQRALTTQQDGRMQAHIRRGGLLVGALQLQSLLDPVRYPLSYSLERSAQFLYEWVKYGQVSPEREVVNGHSCWKLEIANATRTAEKLEIWVDPDIGYCPRQVDIVRRGIGRIRTQFDDYTEVKPGVWFPRLQVSDLPASGTSEARIITNRVKELKGGVFDKASLLVKIPSGTPMYIDDATEPITAP